MFILYVVRMPTSSIVIVFFFLNFLTYFTVCNRDPLLGFTGCNATLQWNIGKSSYKQERTDIRIIDNAGDVIATNENNQCTSQNNLSVSCVISHKNDDWIILFTLMNITTNHTGNYTAWLREDLHFENKTTPFIVIDKPQIMEVGEPVLNHNFTVMCTTSYSSDCITYYWKINGSDLQDSMNIHASMSTLTYRNVTMIDNFSMLTCRAGIEKCSNILCNSSEDSDPYTVEPYYGPLYLYLSLNESLVYLEENRTFKVKCLASCYPACTFRWRSHYINVENEELVINNFNEKLSGVYTCTANNRATGVTANSYPLFLRAKDFISVTTIHSNIHIDDTGHRELLYWIGPPVFLVAAFVIFVTVWRIKASRKIGSPKGSRLLKRFSRTKKSGMVTKDYHETGTNSQPIISLQRCHDGSKLQEDPYNTIDENVLTVYDYSTYNAIEETSQETERRPEHRMYYYASSSDVYHVEAADVHATNEGYLNPISDLAHPSETCQLDETDMNGTDNKYITIIDDFSHSVEETNVTEADPTYLTPIMGSQ